LLDLLLNLRVVSHRFDERTTSLKFATVELGSTNADAPNADALRIATRRLKNHCGMARRPRRELLFGPEWLYDDEIFGRQVFENL
jgi:hypothetical protein